MFADALTFLEHGEKTASSLGYGLVGSTKKSGGIFRKVLVVESENPAEMKEEVHKNRMKYQFIAVKPLSFSVAREASSFSMVDAIVDPYDGRNDIGVDHVVLKFASSNNVAICLTFYKFLMSHRKDRIRVIRAMEKIIKLSTKYETPLILCSGAREEYEMRGPREIMSLAMNLGISYEHAMKALSETPVSIFTKNEMKISNKMFGEVIEYG